MLKVAKVLTKRLILGFAFVGFLSGCTTPIPTGFFVQRTEDTAEIQVGGATQDPDETFYRGAYEFCRIKTNKGFEVKQKDRKSCGSGCSFIIGMVKCTGNVDAFLTKKYEASALRILIKKSDTVFQDGYRFHLVTVKDSAP